MLMIEAMGMEGCLLVKAASLTHSLCLLQGKYEILLELYNEHRSIVACANATVLCS